MNEQERGLVLPGLFVLLGLAILIGLGLWQLDRRTWKETLIADITRRLAGPPIDLPAPAGWRLLDRSNHEFRRVLFPAEFLHEHESHIYTNGSPLRPDVKGPGYWIFTPARLAGGSIVIVNRGFVPLDHKEPSTRAQGQTAGVEDLVGVIRWPEERGLFSPKDDPRGNSWYTRDPVAISVWHNLSNVAPFYVDLEAPVPSGQWPKPGPIKVQLANNHLQYALTWFALAGVLVIVFAVWLTGRNRAKSSGPKAGQ